MAKHDVIHKLEVHNIHNVWRCRQRITEPRPWYNMHNKMMKIGRVVTDNRQTHKQTDTLIAILHVPPLLAAE